MVISGRSRGGDGTHNLPLTGIYKVISAQVLALVEKLSFSAYVHF